MNLNKHDLECLMNYYYGKSELEEIGYKELKEKASQNNLRRIYGVYENNEYDAWYLISAKKGKSKIIPVKKGDIKGNKIVQSFKEKTQFYHIRPDLIKKFARGSSVIFYKNNEIKQNKKINCKEYLEKIKYPLCYAKCGDSYLIFAKYRDIYISSKFETEEQAILSLLSICEYDSSKIKTNNLLDFVVDNRFYGKEQMKEELII